MKTIKILAFAVVLGTMTQHAVAQEQKVKPGYRVAITQTEPEFPGGQDALTAFMHDNLKYPKSLIDSKAGGRVSIMFIVDRDGKIVDPVIMKGVNAAINEEALRVVKMMPDWKPGTAGGSPVNKQYILPIDFIPPSI